MKKLVAMILAMAMILCLSTTAFAAEETYKLTITGATGHTYDIYQIFTGDVAQEDDDTVLSNVKYGASYYPADGKVGDPVPEKMLEDLVKAQEPVDILHSGIKNVYRNDVAPAEGATSIVIEDLPAGYYMIVDVTADLPNGQTKSPIMLQVLETVTIASKHATISSEKKVDDKNDSDAKENDKDWQDSADYDFGDDVPFQLSVTLPSTLTTHDEYTLTFHDKQAAGFADPENFEVYILLKNGTEIPVNQATGENDGYKVLDCTSDKCEFGSCSFTVEVGDITKLYGEHEFTEGDKLYVEYTAKLLETANVGKDGNENGMYVCHPDGHTPEDYVIVFTYELTINKVDGATDEALPGAGFTLYKWNTAANEGAGDWVVVAKKDAGDTVSTFTWSGIDGGKYKLEETETPAGYNTMAPIEFVIDSNHKVEWIKGGNSAFLDLIAKDPTGTVIVFADKDEAAVEDGKLEGDVENHMGAVLPETGAEGTFMLLTCSAALVMMAAVFMVTRKKMSVYED